VPLLPTFQCRPHKPKGGQHCCPVLCSVYDTNKLHPPLKVHYHLQSARPARLFLHLSNTLNPGVTSVLPQRHWQKRANSASKNSAQQTSPRPNTIPTYSQHALKVASAPFEHAESGCKLRFAIAPLVAELLAKTRQFRQHTKSRPTNFTCLIFHETGSGCGMAEKQTLCRERPLRIPPTCQRPQTRTVVGNHPASKASSAHKSNPVFLRQDLRSENATSPLCGTPISRPFW
jgi:hypothetical protein